MGVVGGIPFGAFALACAGGLALEIGNGGRSPNIDDRGQNSVLVVSAIVGAVAGGVGGYFLGEEARDGSEVASAAVVGLNLLSFVGIPAVLLGAFSGFAGPAG
jgi:hypothetical protein